MIYTTKKRLRIILILIIAAMINFNKISNYKLIKETNIVQSHTYHYIYIYKKIQNKFE